MRKTMISPELFSETMAYLLRCCRLTQTEKRPVTVTVHAPDLAFANAIASNLWEFEEHDVRSLKLCVDEQDIHDFWGPDIVTAWAEHILPLSNHDPHLRDAIASRLPEDALQLIEDCEISIYKDCLHLRFLIEGNEARERSIDLIRWICPVLRAMNCQYFVSSSPNGYAGKTNLSGCEVLAAIFEKESEIKLRFNALLESLPERVRDDLGNITGCLFAEHSDVIEIRFSNSDKHLGRDYKPLPVVLEALPWLANCDKHGFNWIRLFDISGDRATEVFVTLSPQQLQLQRRPSLEQLLGKL